ncbi:MAG: allantoate amidohydrolase [Carbonactinosporaceae bacterium]
MTAPKGGPGPTSGSEGLVGAFRSAWAELLPVGRDAATGGYHRLAWTEADLACRAWFRAQAAVRGMAVVPDRGGNLWAWWGEPGPDAVVTGSHLDSVPGGGTYDGPLGVIAGFLAVDLLCDRAARPVRPVAVVAFSDEEGARFGVACLGSRLITGGIDRRTALALVDDGGVTLADAMRAAGADPDVIGRDGEALARIGVFVELHIEQGRTLADLGAAVGVATGIWPHGRWRFRFDGAANHAGTTRLPDRRDPMPACAATVLAARAAAEHSAALCTVGKVRVEPGGVNAVPSRVDCWLDARAPDTAALDAAVARVRDAAHDAAAEHRVTVEVREESYSPPVEFEPALRDRLVDALGARDIQTPVLPTGAGHDAGVLSGHVPAAMLFVRNPTGVSHAPDEHAGLDDCLAGVEALAAALEELACR